MYLNCTLNGAEMRAITARHSQLQSVLRASGSGLPSSEVYALFFFADAARTNNATGL